MLGWLGEYPEMESRVCCEHIAPLLALAVYKEPPAVSVSAVGVRYLFTAVYLCRCSGLSI